VIIIAVITLIKLCIFKVPVINLPINWFWDQKRITLNNYTASNTRPVYYYQIVKPGSKEDILLIELKEKLDFEGLESTKTFALVAPELAMVVSIARSVQSLRMKTNPSQFFSKSWKNFPDVELRQEIINHFNKKLSEWKWNENLTLECSPVLPVVHGTELTIAWKIAEEGFAALSTLDKGYFGKGIYFSTSAKYVTQYLLSYYMKRPTILICLIIPGNVYPVTESPNSEKSIMGHSLISGYQSHYAVTTNEGFPFTKKDYEQEEPKYDEVVIGQESQVVPIFLLEMRKEGMENISEELKRVPLLSD